MKRVVAPDGIQVVVRCPPGLPSELGSDGDVARSDEVLVSAYAAEDGAWDGFLPDCVLDPAVHAAPSLPRPIHGIGRLIEHISDTVTLRPGDVILQINGKNVRSGDEGERVSLSFEDGENHVTLLRKGRRITVTVGE